MNVFVISVLCFPGKGKILLQNRWTINVECLLEGIIGGENIRRPNIIKVGAKKRRYKKKWFLFHPNYSMFGRDKNELI
jgi:hypothetical protein